MRNHKGSLSVLSILVLSVPLSALLTFVLSVPFSGFAFQAMPSPSHWDEMLIKHKWDAIPDSWVSLGQPPNGTTIKLHIALKPNHDNALIDALHEVSHPRHPKYVLFTGTPQLEAYSRVCFRYGAHLSREQVAGLIAPHPGTLDLVFSWLKYNGVPPSSISVTHGGSWLTVAGIPVSRANKLLGASYELYYHIWAKETILRTVGYALPAVLHTHVKTIAPTTAFTLTRPLQQTPLGHSEGEAAAANITSGEPSDVLSRVDKFVVQPSFLRWLYSMPFNNPSPTKSPTVRNKLGIAGFVNRIPKEEDLFKFMSIYRNDVNPRIASTQIVTVVPVNGGVDDRSRTSKQANVDTQFSVALTFPTPIEYYTIGGIPQSSESPSGMLVPADGDNNLQWLRYMTNLESVPQTISVPYFTREQDLSEEYAKTLCDLFKVLGARGASVLAASGDLGVGRGNKVILRPLPFSTSFPASCTCDV